MTSSSTVIAIDLGAESGRVISANLAANHISLDVKHRFQNDPVKIHNTLYWDILRLWHEVQDGINACLVDKPSSIGVDSWGLDFGLLDKNGQLISNPIHYRDSNRVGILEQVSKEIPLEEIYEATGIQLMDINGVYLLHQFAKNSPIMMDIVKTFLTIPDLINYFLTGAKVCEFTNATTTQAYDPIKHNWAYDMLERLDIPAHIFPDIVQPGTKVGEYQGIPVTAPACHDTGSAVVAVPAATQDYAYISSGTWSLMGIEVKAPIITHDSFTANLTNEGGINQTFRLLKNIMGLWLLQQCRATWKSESKSFTYKELVQLAERSRPFSAMIDPDYPPFLLPGNMPQKINDYCIKTKQFPPPDIGSIVRCILESLAFKYRAVLDQLFDVSGKSIETIHIIGGGSQNELLCQMTANVTDKHVVAGPVEATSIGNALVQWMAIGNIDNLEQGRELIHKSFNLTTYEPQNHQMWKEQYQKFVSMTKAHVMEQPYL